MANHVDGNGQKCVYENCFGQHMLFFVFSEAGYLCIPAVLPVLKEVVDTYVPEDNTEAQDNQEDPATVILGVVANIFQKIIELLARRLRKDPEEGTQVH